MRAVLFGFLHIIMIVCAGLSVSDALADATVPTADIEGASDSPLLKRYDGSYIVSYEQFSYTDFVVPLSPLQKSTVQGDTDEMNNRIHKPEKQLELEGQLTRLAYVLPEQRSPLEVLRNYEDVIAQAGGKIVFTCKKEQCGGDSQKASYGGGGNMSLVQFFFHASQLKHLLYSNGYCVLTSRIDDQRYLTAHLPQEDDDAYVTVHTFSLIDTRPGCKELNGRTVALVHVLNPKPRDQKMVVVEASTMAQSLSTEGSISLYGILFDFDKADIKPESRPALDEIAKLLKSDQDLSIIVVGHTDNKGAFDYNIDLSSRRAIAVSQELTATYGIEKERLTAAGAGMMAPVATNDTDEGRAKNRRVELVKRN